MKKSLALIGAGFGLLTGVVQAGEDWGPWQGLAGASALASVRQRDTRGADPGVRWFYYQLRNNTRSTLELRLIIEYVDPDGDRKKLETTERIPSGRQTDSRNFVAARQFHSIRAREAKQR